MWINYPDEQNCCLISIYQNGTMTLREIGERIGVSFARIKQIETQAISKMKGNSLIER
jgi:DNA-directed RNA polymerase sigma subunit (sigma70/sigma32)